MSAALSTREIELQAAWRQAAALTAEIKAGKYSCWCGSPWGSFQIAKGGPRFCRSHVEYRPDGLQPINQTLELPL